MRTNVTERILVAVTFLTCLSGALLLDADCCPDECGRQLISDYIYKTGKLPTGDEPETVMDGWEFSYAIRPYLASIVGACCMKAAALFTLSPKVLLAMSRMCSILSVTGCAYFSVKAGNILFKERDSSLLLAVMICFLPQVAFLGMYQNNDALALMAVSMELFFLLRGYTDNWSIGSCLGLGLSMSIGMLSYYNIYPWILLGGIFCIVSCLRSREIDRKASFIASRSGLVIGTVFVLSGWFFIRNAIVHHGDLLGIAYENVQREAARARGEDMIEAQPGREFFRSDRKIILHWMLSSYMSFVGCFGYMNIFLSKVQYLIYGLSVGALEIWVMIRASLRKRETELIMLFQVLLVAGAIASVVLSVYVSYCMDYQPQGRYIITAVFPLAFAMAYGMDRFAGKAARRIFIAAWLGMFLWAFFGTMSTMFLWAGAGGPGVS